MDQISTGHMRPVRIDHLLFLLVVLLEIRAEIDRPVPHQLVAVGGDGGGRLQIVAERDEHVGTPRTAGPDRSPG